MSESELTYADAQALLDGLSLDNTEWRQWGKRSDGERLAIGLIILQRHMRGKSMRDIEKELGIPLATCQRYKQRALESIQIPTVETARKEELDRIDTIIATVWPAVESGDDKAINTYLKVSERRAKLLGLDKPIQIEQQVTEITAAERELQDLLAQAERDDALATQAVLEGLQ